MEQNRRLDPRRETMEVFPEGVLLVVDESALLSSDGVRTGGPKLLKHVLGTELPDIA